MNNECTLYSQFIDKLGIGTKISEIDCCKDAGYSNCETDYDSIVHNVEYIELMNYNSTGVIDPIIGKFKKLKKLSLINLSLTGSIPSEIENLKNLEILNLSSNELTESIPNIGKLSSLKEFIVNDNNLNGEIPNSISNNKNLQIFNINNNQISGNIPKEIGELSNLTKLNMKNNLLTGIISNEFSSLTKLKEIDLSGNKKLSGYLPIKNKLLQNCYFNDTKICKFEESYCGNTDVCTSEEIKSADEGNSSSSKESNNNGSLIILITLLVVIVLMLLYIVFIKSKKLKKFYGKIVNISWNKEEEEEVEGGEEENIKKKIEMEDTTKQYTKMKKNFEFENQQLQKSLKQIDDSYSRISFNNDSVIIPTSATTTTFNNTTINPIQSTAVYPQQIQIININSGNSNNGSVIDEKEFISKIANNQIYNAQPIMSAEEYVNYVDKKNNCQVIVVTTPSMEERVYPSDITLGKD